MDTTDAAVFAYFQETKQAKLIVIANLSSIYRTFIPNESGSQLLTSSYQDSGDTLTTRKKVGLHPRETVAFALRGDIQ